MDVRIIPRGITMKLRLEILFFHLILILSLGVSAFAKDPALQQLLDQVGIKPQGDQRGQMDVVGFATTAEQMDEVMAQCRQLVEKQKSALQERHGWIEETTFMAGVCPHDDYYYAGRLYSLLLSRIRN